MENIKEINLTELVTAIVRKIWLVILCALVVGIGAYIYTDNFVEPQYRTSVKIYVNNKESTTNASGVSANDLATSQRLVLTYVNILRSDTVLDKVADKIHETTGKRVSAAAIRGTMTAGAMEETEIFEVFISNPNPEMCAVVANAIADVAPAEIAYFVEGSSTKIVDYAKVPGAPYSPNVTQNTMIGMIAGALVAVAVVVLQTLLDVRIKGEEDLALISKAPVLGMIPDLMIDDTDKGYRSGYKYQGYKAQPMKAQDKEADL